MATLLLAVPIELSAQSGGDGLEKPGDCTKEEYRQLYAAIGPACKAAPMKREASMECGELLERWKRFQACIQARRALMDRCFRGGDQTHRDRLDQDLRGQETCVKYMRLKCRLNEDEDETCGG